MYSTNRLTLTQLLFSLGCLLAAVTAASFRWTQFHAVRELQAWLMGEIPVNLRWWDALLPVYIWPCRLQILCATVAVMPMALGFMLWRMEKVRGLAVLSGFVLCAGLMAASLAVEFVNAS